MEQTFKFIRPFDYLLDKPGSYASGSHGQHFQFYRWSGPEKGKFFYYKTKIAQTNLNHKERVMWATRFQDRVYEDIKKGHIVKKYADKILVLNKHWWLHKKIDFVTSSKNALGDKGSVYRVWSIATIIDDGYIQVEFRIPLFSIKTDKQREDFEKRVMRSIRSIRILKIKTRKRK